jgi:phage head maturation protease
MEPDFGGYATKAGIKCTDGRVITPEAFKHMDGTTVPLVWQHGHPEVTNVLGHVVLEVRHDGVYCKGFFNATSSGVHANSLVQHGDIKCLSIYANQLVEKAKVVLHGMIREVSLVLAGANPGAMIDQVRVQHSDGELEVLSDEAVVYSGVEIELKHSAGVTEPPVVESETESRGDVEHAADDTVKVIYESMTEEQQTVLHYMVGKALETAVAHSDDEITQSEEGTNDMTRNVFEGDSTNDTTKTKGSLTHDDMATIVASAQRLGSLKAAVSEYAIQHGITNIEILFPDAKTIDGTPEWIKRRTEWVSTVLGGARKIPFSRIKTRTADITEDEARAKGYIKGSMKKEEFFSVSQRTTTPTTVYKKQKLDRDDVIDIKDFDVVSWLRGEMRLMIEEEIARAILISDGRASNDPDKIKDPVGAVDGAGIRSILNDHELYVTQVNVNVDDANSTWQEVVESILLARRYYKGTGSPTFFTTDETLTRMLLIKDGFGRRLYNSIDELATALRVARIETVEVMESVPNLIGIIVNMADYAIGADRGGELTMFDDFDIDYNQMKYLIEARLSGGLAVVKSALVVRKVAAAAVLVSPVAPTFVPATGVVTIPTVTGVTYKNETTNANLTAGAQTALAAGATLKVIAVPASASYYFETNETDQFEFTRPA